MEQLLIASRLYRVLTAIALLAIQGSAEVLAQIPALPATVSEEERIVNDAAVVLDEMLNAPGVATPRSMLEGAEGVAIVPRVIKGGFIVGARHGRGVVITKDAQGVWHAPIFLTLTGGNIGWQAGLQATDVVLVYKTQRGIESLMQGKLTLGADIAAAAGPVGREAAAATDTTLRAEVYSYSRSRGLFAGVSLDGSVLKIDHPATAVYYRPTTPGGRATVPIAAQQLTSRVVALAQPQDRVAPPTPQETADAFVGTRHSLDEAALVREQLADAAARLFRLLDPAWQQHLALPAEVFRESGHPPTEALAAASATYNRIAADPRYASLAGSAEFQSVLGLLRHYAQLVANERPTLALPPPPQ